MAICARRSLVESMRMRLFRLRHDGLYRKKVKNRPNTSKMARSRILVVTCKMRFFRLHGGGGVLDELTLMNCHLHFMTAKKGVANASASFAGFWNEVADAIIEFRVRILVGDFNMALWCVVPELRARGLQVNLAAWYPWKHRNEAEPRMDSTAMFVIGPCAGAHKIFGVETIRPSAVAEPAPKGWENLLEPIFDDKNKVVGRRPWPLPTYSLLGQGFQLGTYRPSVPERMAQFVSWTFAPTIDKEAPAMRGPVRAGIEDREMFPTRPPGCDRGAQSWDWPALPSVKQKLVDVKKFDPGMSFFTAGAHMPLMAFVEGVSRRTPEALQRRTERAKERGWHAVKNEGPGSTWIRGGGGWDGGAAAWRDNDAAAEHGGRGARWSTRGDGGLPASSSSAGAGSSADGWQ